MLVKKQVSGTHEKENSDPDYNTIKEVCYGPSKLQIIFAESDEEAEYAISQYHAMLRESLRVEKGQQTVSSMVFKPSPEENENLKKYGFKSLEVLRDLLFAVPDDDEAERLSKICEQWKNDLKQQEQESRNNERKNI